MAWKPAQAAPKATSPLMPRGHTPAAQPSGQICAVGPETAVLLQAEAPAAEVVPAAHRVQVVAPAAEKLPAGQGLLALLLQNEPAAQGRQAEPVSRVPGAHTQQ